MFKKIHFVITLVITLGLSINLLAASEIEKQQLVNDTIQVSGVKEQFASFDSVMQDTINRMFATNSELNTDEKEELRNIILKDLSQEAVVNKITQVVSDNMSEDKLKDVISAYQLEIMQKVKQAKLKATKPEEQQEFINFVMSVNKNPPSTERLKLVKKLDDVIQASKFQAELMSKMLATMMTSFNQLDNKLTDDQLIQTINNVNMFMQEAAKEQVKMSFLFTFKDLSDDEISQYIKVEESEPSLQALNKNIFNGVGEFFTGYSAYLGSELAKFNGDHKKAA